MVDRCVCCGAVIPEGTQVCINCRRLYMESEHKSSDSFRGFAGSKTEDHRKKSGR